ncbi:hypothetical protein [Celeribacter sp.]|uniref:hypothetical protein n=1 Tax=Celeribacter sp. TaxID=1890673 RepID=UPI003A8EC823
MSETDRTIILKLLNGTQSGAEVALSDGVYSFGSGEDADLRLIDIAMPALQGRIRVSGSKIALQALGTPLSMASGLVIEPGGEDWREIAQLDVVTAATTRFALGVEGANWAELLIPGASAAQASKSAKSWSLPKLEGWTMPASAAALVVLLGLGVAGVALQSPQETSPSAQSADTAGEIATLRSVLASLTFPAELDAAAEADGRLIVTGYVPGAAERRAVENAIAETGLNVHRRIWALDAMQADIDGLLSAQDPNLTASLAPDGVVTLAGVHLDPAETDEIVTTIRTQVFGLSAVQNDIRTAGTYLAEVQALINRLSLTDLVIARLDGMLIETTGVIPAEKADNWVGFVQAYAKRFANDVPLRSFVTLENAPASDNSVPLVVGKSEIIGALGGRQLSSQSLTDGVTLGPDQVFGPFTPDSDPQLSEAESASGGAPNSPPTRTTVPPLIASVISDYAANNPDVVDAIVASATNGRVTSLSALQAGQFSSAGVPPQIAMPGSAAAGTIAALLQDNTEAQTGLSALPATGTDYERFPVGAPDDPRSRQLMSASARLFAATDTGDLALSETAQALLPGLAQLSPELFHLAQRQQAALQDGQTLLRGPRPLSAQPYRDLSTEGQCWPGASLHAETLPAVMLWLDILSLGRDADLSGFDDATRQTILEAALSPDRLRACLMQEVSPFSMRLATSSTFLQETERNDRFADYIFRDTPRFPLVMTGVDLSGARYVMLENGRKLHEGSAPTLDSRIVSIGELGVLLRLTSGYQVALYPDRLSWKVSTSE